MVCRTGLQVAYRPTRPPGRRYVVRVIAHPPVALWIIFAAAVVTLCAIDLGVLTRRPQPLSFHGALRWSVVVVLAAIAFCAAIWIRRGRADAIQFATGYIVELSLSVDNLLVFLLVLQYFRTPPPLYSTALKWGILGAIVMRGVMIAAGTELLHQIAWVIYVLGALLIATGLRLAFAGDAAMIDPERNLVVRTAEHLIPVTDTFVGQRFAVRRDARWLATPLLLTVVVIEWTDLVFATDSIPAIFAITRDPFLIYTSNIFAIVGLRALFFVVAGMLARFSSLRHGVSAVLVLIGARMLVERWITIPPWIALAGVVGILGASIAIPTRPPRSG